MAITLIIIGLLAVFFAVEGYIIEQSKIKDADLLNKFDDVHEKLGAYIEKLGNTTDETERNELCKKIDALFVKEKEIYFNFSGERYE